MSDLIHRGGAVKALPNGHVEGYLVVFGDAGTPDLSLERDFFTANTDFGLEDGMKSAVYYAHALDPTIKNRRLTNVSMKVDDVGVWVEGQMKARDEYEKALLKMAEDGKLGWSSGTASHLVTRKAIETEGGTVHEILSWPLGLDASLTPTPAEPRASAAYTLKSLAAMIEAEPPADTHPDAEDHTVKALPSGMSYDDLRSLLQDELNEDFATTDPDGDATPFGGLWIADIYDDALVYRDDDDLYRIPYTVTAGNDVTWGVAECVIRTTVYQSVAGEDAEDTLVSMAGKGVDVAALKGLLRGSMTLDDHADVVRDAMSGFAARAEALGALSVKAGRPMSAARHAKLAAAYGGMQTAHTAMAAHLQAINEMLLSTDPDAKKEAEEVAALRMDFLRRQARTLGIAV